MTVHDNIPFFIGNKWDPVKFTVQ